MRSVAMAVFLALLIVPRVAFSEEYNTIEELANAFNDDKCGACHEKIFEQWLSTPHANSVNLSLGGMRNFLVLGVKDWWGRKITKEEVMKCLDCHAPSMKFASEALAVEVADMIVTAIETEDEEKRESVRKELTRLNIGCLSCHNIKATTIAPGRLGETEKGAVYGLEGKPSPAHKTIKSAELGTALYCMQCHGNYTAPNGEVIKCNTLSGSYQDGYVARGGSKTCQDCHMRAENRGHGMLGGRDLELVKEGIGFTVEVSQYLHLPGKGEKLWTPSALVSVELENRAGHRIPDG